jgi:hypothetical protein
MNTRRISGWFWTLLAFVFLTTLTCLNAVAQPPAPTYSIQTSGGLTVVTFNVTPGTIWVNLPDDIRAGDVISGILRGQPKGTTEAERADNLALLREFRINFANRSGTQPTDVRWGDYQTFSIDVAKEPSDKPLSVGVKKATDPTLIQVSIPVSRLPPGSIFGPDPATVAAANARWGDYSSDPNTSFRIPMTGQQGRPINIYGPFDGNTSNTTIEWKAVRGLVTDVEKNTGTVPGGSGVIRPLAESPRKVIFELPAKITGPVQLFLDEGGKTATATHRNVGVQLSAPKTSLMRGEKTVVTIEVSGLAGITKDVPLQLESKGVITMEGGSFQNLRIKPEDVKLDGRYTTKREITGLQAGGFGVTATVIVGPFDLSLQDDTDPNRLFHFNSFTGDYIFACGGGSCRNGGTGGTSSQPPPGSSEPPPAVNLTGIGKPQMKGCIITLTHNAPDRRVFARLDACTRTGDASLETKSPKANFNITDKNTANNTAASPPPD